MKSYLVKLVPTEPYFFGNEKSFKFDGQKNSGQMSNQYFIRSERTPLQSTLLGTMRYVFLPHKKDWGSYSENELKENCDAVGERSFNIEAETAQNFGLIKKISPLFIMNGDEKFVVTPFDHKIEKFDHESEKNKYTPFEDYYSIITDSGEKLYTTGFDSKNGIADSYMNVRTGEIVSPEKIFATDSRVGLNKNNDEKAFHKREFYILKNGYSFAFYITLDDAAKVPENKVNVFMGQSKSMFTAEFVPEENIVPESISRLLGEDIIYCFGDTLADSSIYNSSKFAIVKTRDYRAYLTGKKGNVVKGSKLYKLIKAGSIFKADDFSTLENCIKNPNCTQTGFNIIVKNQEV